MVVMETKNNRPAVADKESAVRAWNHDGFISRMNDRLEKVRLMNQNDDSVNYQTNKTKIRVM